MSKPKSHHYAITEHTVLVYPDGKFRAAKVSLLGVPQNRVVLLTLDDGTEIKIYLD